MVIEKDDKITTSLENESYKGIKTIAKDAYPYRRRQAAICR